MNIILVGFMGSGKTTVGKIIAGSLGMNFIDMDDKISNEAGKTVNEIFSEMGESFFREQETLLLKKLLLMDGLVIATGGGAVIREENRRLLKQIGSVFFLSADEKTVFERLENDTSRPLLQENKKERISSLLKERNKIYNGVADHCVDVDGLNAEEVAKKVISFLEC